MGKIDNEKQRDHEYERLNPGAETPSPHRPEFSHGMDSGKSGGTYGDADKKSPKEKDPDRSSGTGGQPPEKVEDRSNVSTVRPEDYPDEKRKNSS